MLEILRLNRFRKHKLSKKLIEKNLKTLCIGKNINIADKIDSTNNWAKREIKNGCISGAVFLADAQEKGRGRMGSSWKSKRNKDILMTVVLCFKDREIPDFITLSAGLAVQTAMCELLDCCVSLKWPNDVFINDKKVCGILCESVKTESGNMLIIGIGINANSYILDSDIKNTATSIYLSTGKKIKREELISKVLNMLEKYLKLSTNKVIEEYKKACISIGKNAELFYNGQNIKGRIIDVTNNGELLIKCKNSKIIAINSIYKIRQKF